MSIEDEIRSMSMSEMRDFRELLRNRLVDLTQGSAVYKDTMRWIEFLSINIQDNDVKEG